MTHHTSPITRCMSYRFAESLRTESGRNWFGSAAAEPNQFASCQQTCLTYTITVCRVQNSWWWTEELSETCRVLFQK